MGDEGGRAHARDDRPRRPGAGRVRGHDGAAEGSAGLIHWALRTCRDEPARAHADASLTVAERARLGALHVPKRRADWLVGRITAKSVVAASLASAGRRDWPLRAIEIPAGPDGAPYARVAPELGPVAGYAGGERLPISVSISHAGGHALCAATWHAAPADAPRRRLGIDLERVEPRSPDLLATFFTPEERRFVGDAPAAERGVRANLVWCAKEAVLKAFGLGLRVDTWELTCLPVPGLADPSEWPMAPADPGWRPFVATCGAALGGGTVRGVWRSFPGFVGALAARSA